MYPIICQIGPFNIYAYGVMLVAAFMVASGLSRREARKHGVDPEVIFNLSFRAFVSGIIGARTLYILQNIGYYLKNPTEIIMLQHGGLSWFGGLFFGVVFGITYLKTKNQPLYEILDLIIPFVALGQAIGRIGCLLNGCCFGQASSLIPIQIYSSLALILIFVILRLLQARPHRQGEVFFSYLLLYSIKRFLIEFWRVDNEIIFLGLTLFQLFGAALFLFSLVKFITLKKSKV